MAAPLVSHWTVVKRILRYLKGMLFHGLLLQSASTKNPLATSRTVIFLGPNLISWWSHKQKVTARSSIEAEYRSIAQTSIEFTWIYTLLIELQVSFTTPIIFCDNQSAVSIAHNPVFHSRTKHMEIDVFFVREKILAK